MFLLTPAVAAIIVVVAMLTAFILGFTAADATSRRIQKGLHAQLRLAQDQRYRLAQWVRTNWPNEYAAYQNGFDQGYQQGVTEAPALMEDAAEIESALP